MGVQKITRTYYSVVEKSKIDDVIFGYDSLLHSLLGNSIFGQLVWGGALAGICFTTEVIPSVPKVLENTWDYIASVPKVLENTWDYIASVPKVLENT